MSRMKTFLKYAILVILFYVFSQIMINVFINISYTDIKDYQIEPNDIFVDVTEAKASNRNGTIKGIIKNPTENTIENKYLKISMLSKYGNVVGEKYVKIDKINSEQLLKFEVSFDFDNVKTFKIEVVDNKPEEEDFIELVKNNVNDLLSNNIY